jgi:hypothetical protein
MCILQMCQPFNVYYIKALFEEYITSKSTIIMAKWQITGPVPSSGNNSQESWVGALIWHGSMSYCHHMVCIDSVS